MTDANRIVIVGGGHNGLVCAAYLARAGRKVLVLEANEQFGGAAVTREFHPGFKVSAVAHLLHLLDPRIARELDLAKHGLAMARENLQTVALSETGSGTAMAVISGSFNCRARRGSRRSTDRSGTPPRGRR